MVASRKVFTLAAALAAGALVSAGAAQAATTLYWGGNTPGTNGNWSTSPSDTPWATSSSGTIGTSWADGDNANFQNGGTDTVTVVGTIGATTQVPTITVNNSTTADLLGSGTVNVSGSGVSLGLAGAANSTLVSLIKIYMMCLAARVNRLPLGLVETAWSVREQICTGIFLKCRQWP